MQEDEEPPPLLLPVEGKGGLERNGKYDCDLVARMRLPVGILSQTECLCLPRGLPGMGVESGVRGGGGGYLLSAFDGRARVCLKSSVQMFQLFIRNAAQKH